MKKVVIVVGDANYPETLNKEINEAVKEKNVIDVKTTGFSSIGHHKKDYVLVTLILEK